MAYYVVDPQDNGGVSNIAPGSMRQGPSQDVTFSARDLISVNYKVLH